jgi:type I restriction enzyme S subunit
MDGSTGRQRLRKETLASKKLPFPPLEEQRRIAHVLKVVQDAVSQQERLIRLTAELKQALMSKLFSEGMCNERQKRTDIGLVPESWGVETLDGLLSQTQYGLSVRGEETGRYGILRMTNQVEGKISTEKMQFVDVSESDFEKYRLRNGDILFNRTNSIELVGRTAIFDSNGEYVFASYLIRMKTNGERLDPYFLNHYLNWGESQRRLKSIALRAIGQSNISATRLRTFQIPLPSLEEQADIIERIDAVIAKLRYHRRKRDLLQELLHALLHQLMTGQISVKELKL